MARAESLPDGPQREKAIRKAAVDMLEDGVDPSLLAEWLWKQPNNGKSRTLDYAWLRVVSRMAFSNPGEAEDWLMKLGPDWSETKTAARSLAKSRVARGIDEAGAWANSLPPGVLRDVAYSGIARHLAAEDAKAAVAWCLYIEDSTIMHNTLTHMMPAWIQAEPEQAANWVDALPAGSQKDAVLRGLIATVVNRDPQTASLWAEGIDSPSERRSAVARVAAQWAQTDPGRTADWIDGMPVSVRDWACKDIATVLLQRRRLDEALTWANGIQDDRLRENILGHIVRLRQ
jgi:hypothetical protein